MLFVLLSFFFPIVTVIVDPCLTLVPAPTSCAITLSTLSVDSLYSTFIINPNASKALVASSLVFPFKSGTVDSLNV